MEIIPKDILTTITIYCEDHDYVALFIALPRLSRQLIGKLDDVTFRRRRCAYDEKWVETIAVYEMYSISFPIVSPVNFVWRDQHVDVANDIIVSDIVCYHENARAVTKKNTISIPFSLPTYIHIVKSIRSIVKNISDEAIEEIEDKISSLLDYC